MKKRIIAGIVLLVIAACVIYGYLRINKEYPQRIFQTIKQGEFTEFQDGVYIRIDRSEMVGQQEYEEACERIGESAVGKSKVWKVYFTLENRTDEVKTCEMTTLNMEAPGLTSGIAARWVDGFEEEWSPALQELQPGESKHIWYPFEFSSLYFPEDMWENMEDETYWITFSSYPVKNKMMLD